ncbi:hypothetical protein Anas_05510, partial [Armadillidium nasatum]
MIVSHVFMQANDTETATSPFQTSFSVTSETTLECPTSVPPSGTSSHRSSTNNKSRFSFFNVSSLSRPPSSGTNSVHRRKPSVKSVQFGEKKEKRNSILVPNTTTTTINEEEKEDLGSGVIVDGTKQKEEDREDSSDEDEDEDNPLQKLIAPLISIFQLIIRSSYIATNIVMMAWSITYHSWLTFVLLMWACVL